jgi:alanyl-tRNA synthetase
MMTGHEIRQKFLDYFAARGHRVVRSSPLLPANDPTLLFTNAGMNQFKDVFLGVEPRDYKRAASSQKCVRAGGKHNDLDEVGRTARHHTFFEMLGNFSFGDYFKKEAIYFAWDLLVNEFKLDPQRLWFSVFAGDQEVAADEEAVRYWEQVGAPPERILRFGRKDNFWQMGETGPCGPCSEVHYYQGPHPEDPQHNRPELVNGVGDTTMEIWNLVFMQFNRSKVGDREFKLDPLPAPSVDTGMGLERVAAVIQGAATNYDTDLIRPIIDYIAGLCGRDYIYDSEEGFAMRVVADHARATAFSIADGIAPGNVGRNYVLRKIMRRAIYHGAKGLGLATPFFVEVTNFVVDLMGEAFPELTASRNLIGRTVRGEETRFSRILTIGEPRLTELFERYAPAAPPMIELARTYDTYGVPRDLIRVVLGQHGVEMAEDEFNEQFDAALGELQQQSGASMTDASAARRAKEIYTKVTEALPRTEFTGYKETETAGARVLAIVVGDSSPAAIAAGETGEVILDRTPFYSEAGGQIGDAGVFENDNLLATVEDTYSVISGYYLHKTSVERGELSVGDRLTVRVDAERRRRIRANHTGTHLLHAALREVLGSHVKQAGSLVAPDRLRFDFTHYAPLTDDEIAEIERLVNNEVLHNREVETEIKPFEEAVASGAMALFGEKYGAEVRVVSLPGFSTELCGGTHVHATGDIGPFKITSDSSIAAGVRRLEAITADAAVARLQTDEQIIKQATEILRVQPQDIPLQIEKLVDQVRRLEREVKESKIKLAQARLSGKAAMQADGEVSKGEVSKDVLGIKVETKQVSELDSDAMRQLSDAIAGQKPSVVFLIQAKDKEVHLVRSTDKRIDANKIIREVNARFGGKGGGRPDLAMGGGIDPIRVDEVTAASGQIIETIITQAIKVESE